MSGAAGGVADGVGGTSARSDANSRCTAGWSSSTTDCPSRRPSMSAYGSVVKVTPSPRALRKRSASSRSSPTDVRSSTCSAARRHVEHAVEREGVGQGAGRQRLAHDRSEEGLLAGDAVDVLARQPLALAHEGQRLRAPDRLAAGGQVDARHLVLRRLGQADLHAAERVDQRDEAVEVDLRVVVDAQSRQLLDRADEQGRAALQERGVELRLARRHRGCPLRVDVRRDGDPGVARQADELGLVAVAVEVDEDHRVGPLAGDELLAGALDALAAARSPRLSDPTTRIVRASRGSGSGRWSSGKTRGMRSTWPSYCRSSR
jgi:hypothetical protein